MILQALCGYYRRAQSMPGAEIIPPGYSLEGASAELVLAPDGNLAAVNSLLVPDPNDKKGKRMLPRRLLVPLPPKRSGQKPDPAFLYETVAFLFGIHEKPEAAAYRFEASGQIHWEVLQGCGDEGALALLAFLDRRTQGSVRWEGVDTALLENPSLFVVFRLRGDPHFLHERPAVGKAWEAYRARQSQEAEIIQCLVTGEQAPLARLHGNIGGFGQDKPTLVGFNQDSFCSFGKYGQQGANAPVGERAAFEYVTALNLLVRDPAHCVNLAGDKVLFWAEREARKEESLMQLMFGGERTLQEADGLDTTQQQHILNILESLCHGGDPGQHGLDPTVRFYLLGISANKTRLVIRFFHESSFGDLLNNLIKHYQGLAVQGMRYRFPAPYFLLLETALGRDASKVAPNLDSALLRAIVTGVQYPWSLSQGVIRRIRAEGDVNPLRAGILKAALNRQANREVVKMALDPNERDIPYVLGRLFALCEKAQRDALGEVNASIADKYFNTALASPQAAFPPVLKLNRTHLSKIEKDSTKFYMINMITKVIGLLQIQDEGTDKNAFPETLDANGQGKFIVGYYHQNQALYTKRDKGPAADAADVFQDPQEEGGNEDGY